MDYKNFQNIILSEKLRLQVSFVCFAWFIIICLGYFIKFLFDQKLWIFFVQITHSKAWWSSRFSWHKWNRKINCPEDTRRKTETKSRTIWCKFGNVNSKLQITFPTVNHFNSNLIHKNVAILLFQKCEKLSVYNVLC